MSIEPSRSAGAARHDTGRSKRTSGADRGCAASGRRFGLDGPDAAQQILREPPAKETPRRSLERTRAQFDHRRTPRKPFAARRDRAAQRERADFGVPSLARTGKMLAKPTKSATKRNPDDCRSPRASDLLDRARRHDDDAVGQRERFRLVVGDVDHRDASLFLDALQLRAHFETKSSVEIGERLVEHQDFWLHDDGPGERDALLLAARQFPGFALGERRQPHRSCSARSTRHPARLPGMPLSRSPKATFSKTVRCGKERVGLEDEADAAPVGGRA